MSPRFGEQQQRFRRRRACLRCRDCRASRCLPSSIAPQRPAETRGRRATVRRDSRTPPTSRGRAGRAASASVSRLTLKPALPGPVGQLADQRGLRRDRARSGQRRPNRSARPAGRDRPPAPKCRRSADRRWSGAMRRRAGTGAKPPRRARPARTAIRAVAPAELRAVGKGDQPAVEQADRGEQHKRRRGPANAELRLHCPFSIHWPRIAHKSFMARGFPLSPSAFSSLASRNEGGPVRAIAPGPFFSSALEPARRPHSARCSNSVARSCSIIAPPSCSASMIVTARS